MSIKIEDLNLNFRIIFTNTELLNMSENLGSAFSEFQRSSAREVGKYFSEVVFGIEAYETADS